ncbi:MAG TPA: M23 family metallopeptidase [Longimicrobiales bacterium]|nr:M23 family metallopeptidase [Longimicrobiales bacterium]
MSDRRLTFIVVPHGDLETRTYEVSYRALKLGLVAAAVVAGLFVVMVSMWWYVAAQAARVPGLEREVARLEAEREQINELARMLAEVEAQYERVRQLLGGDAAPPGGESLLPPLRGQPEPQDSADEVSTPSSWPLTQLGYITRAISDGGVSHPGLDIAVASDAYIRASGAGRVAEVGNDEVYGLYVLLDHGGGLQSLYGHASRTFVSAGEAVERHQVIGLTGSTGRSTAPHLHFEIRRDDQTVDPLEFVESP